MQKEKSQFRLVEARVCPTCNSSFDSSSDQTHCPADKTLLCPVSGGYESKQVGNWIVLEQIGEGSSGRVYRARHEGTDVFAAIKFLKLNFHSDPTAVKRFHQEALAVKELNDSNIAALYDFGILDEGTPYLVMELVDGTTLQSYLEREGTISEDSIRTIFIQVAEAMEKAHKHAILHRDLKPGNLIVDEKLNVKVVDFGLAKFGDTESGASITKTGTQLGTPAYMSPEQCQGDKADERSDIYSLGCIMYECLTGKQLFDADKAVAFYHKHSFEEPLKPSERLGLKQSVISRSFQQLEEIILGCLRKEPEERIASMSELANALKGKVLNLPTPGKQRFKTKIGASSSIGHVSPPGVKGALVAAIVAILLTSLTIFFVQNQVDNANTNTLQNFSPPYTVYTKATQRSFAIVNGLYMTIIMEGRNGGGFQDRSLIFMDNPAPEQEKKLRIAMGASETRECFAAWRNWYGNIYAYLRGDNRAPNGVRMKLTVDVDKSGAVSAFTDWSDETDNPLAKEYSETIIAKLRKLNHSKMIVFPSSNTQAVSFDVYVGPDGDFKVDQAQQVLH